MSQVLFKVRGYSTNSDKNETNIQTPKTYILEGRVNQLKTLNINYDVKQSMGEWSYMVCGNL